MPKKVTEEQFRERLGEANPAVEPLEAYHGMRSETSFRCGECGGTFRMQPRKILRSGTCPLCGDRRARVRAALRERNVPKAHGEFAAEVSAANPGVRLAGEYRGCAEKVRYVCACGREAYALPSRLTRPGLRCAKCESETHWAAKDAGFRDWLARANPQIEALEPYRGDITAIRFRCGGCGGKFDAQPRLLRREATCPLCGERRKGGPARLTQEEFAARVAAACPGVVVVGTYVTEDVKVECECEKAGHRWFGEPRNLLRGEGCPRCAAELRGLARRLSEGEFLARVADAAPEVEVTGKFEGTMRRIACRCRVCGHEWSPQAAKLLAGQGCGRCSAVHTSFAEQYLLHALERSLGEGSALSRDRGAIGMELDVYVPSARFAVEIGSWYWHGRTDILARDAAKRRAAVEAGIELLTVYTDYAEDTPPFPDGCVCCAEDLGRRRSRGVLERIADEAVERAGGRPLEPSEHAEVASAARAASRRRAGDEFAERLRERSGGTIEAMGGYTRSTEPVACRCTLCGHEWRPFASNVIRRLRCPACKSAGREAAA